MYTFRVERKARSSQILSLLLCYCFFFSGDAAKPVCGPSNDIADGDWSLDESQLRIGSQAPATIQELCCGWDDGLARFGVPPDGRCSGTSPRVGGYGCVCQRSAQVRIGNLGSHAVLSRQGQRVDIPLPFQMVL
jgi:hypothetical protein